MSELTIPNALANGQPQDGNQVDANFDAIKAWADTHVVEKAGATFTGDVILAGNPATALVAAPKQYVDAHKPVALFTRNTDIALSSLGTSDVTFESESGDVDGWWSSGVNFTCPASGLYHLTVVGTITSGAGSPRIKCDYVSGQTQLNNGAIGEGATGYPNLLMGATASTRTASADAQIYFTAGDVFKVVTKEIGNGAVTLNNVRLFITRLALG
jgi:hypothetical protein